jgi:hypothetical protein
VRPAWVGSHGARTAGTAVHRRGGACLVAIRPHKCARTWAHIEIKDGDLVLELTGIYCLNGAPGLQRLDVVYGTNR